MPLYIELPEAGIKLKNNFNRQLDVEQRFSRTESLGDFVSNGFSTNDQFISELDGDPVVRTYNNFTINEGHAVTTTQRCKGLYLFIDGDLTINGTLSMTARGAKAPGKFVGILPSTDEIFFNDVDIFTEKDIINIPAIGGAGAARRGATSRNPFSYNGLNGGTKLRGSGGGGSGAVRCDQATNVTNASTVYSGAGSNGTSFSGGSGGGGAASRYGSGSALAGTANGGTGGNGKGVANANGGAAGGSGGAGAAGPGTSHWTKYAHSSVTFNSGFGNGAGGLIILIVKGSIIFGPNGKIESNGVRAPGISTYYAKYANSVTIATGGGSGGGIVMLFTKQDLIPDDKLFVSGGLGGYRPIGNYGGTGGNGHKEIIKY